MYRMVHASAVARFYLTLCRLIVYNTIVKKGTHILRIVLMLPLLSGGCWNPFCPPTDPPFRLHSALEPVSPEEVLGNLVVAYQTMDIDLYLSCLADSFGFHFDIADQGLEDMLRDLGVKEDWWGKTEERLSTESLFKSFREQGLVVTPLFTILRSDTITSTISLLHTRYAFDPPVIEGLAIEGTATFYLQQNPQGHWQIVEWWDRVSP